MVLQDNRRTQVTQSLKISLYCSVENKKRVIYYNYHYYYYYYYYYYLDETSSSFKLSLEDTDITWNIHLERRGILRTSTTTQSSFF